MMYVVLFFMGNNPLSRDSKKIIFTFSIFFTKMDMGINYDIVHGSSTTELIKRLNTIPNNDRQVIDNMLFFIRKHNKAIHIHSYDINSIANIFQLLEHNRIPCILETEYDIIVPWDDNNMRAVQYAIAYVNFTSMQVDEKDIPHVKLRSVTLMTDEEYLKKYPHNRLTQYALGSQYYINALRTEENIFKTHRCIICTGSFQEIERLRTMIIQQNIPCANLNMDVLCISPDNNADYLYRLLLGGMYYMTMMDLN